MNHYMNLYNEPFEMIKNGEKTIELRLFDEKRKKISVGDNIIFENNNTKETLTVKVINLYIFDSFKELYDSLPVYKCGYRIGETANSSDMDIYYSKEKQSKYGVVGIEIELI